MKEEAITVTKVLKATQTQEQIDSLQSWVDEVGEKEAYKIRESSRLRGIELDRQVKEYFDNKVLPESKALRYLLNKYSILDREVEVVHKDFNYKGRYDAKLKFKLKEFEILGEFKTKNSFVQKEKLNQDWLCQLGAYWGERKSKGEFFKYGMIALFTEDSEVPYIYLFTSKELETYYKTYLSRLIIYNREEGRKPLDLDKLMSL